MFCSLFAFPGRLLACPFKEGMELLTSPLLLLWKANSVVHMAYDVLENQNHSGNKPKKRERDQQDMMLKTVDMAALRHYLPLVEISRL